MEQDKTAEIAAKVAALLAKADDPAATPAEAKLFAEKAAELMIKYEIDSMTLDAGKNGELPIVFGQFRLYANDNKLVPDELTGLVGVVARNFECRVVIHDYSYLSMSEDDGTPLEPGRYVEMVGYKADFDFVQVLFFNLSLTMMSSVMMEIQQIQAKSKTRIKAKDLVNYQREFAQGFVARINERLKVMYGRLKEWDGEVSEGVGLAIMSRLEQVQAKFNAKYPPQSLSTLRVSATNYDPNARARGRAAANGADIGGGQRFGYAPGGGQIGQSRKMIDRG